MRNLCGYVPLCYHQLGEQGMRLCCGLCYNGEPGRDGGGAGWRGRRGGGAAEGGKEGEVSLQEICAKCT